MTKTDLTIITVAANETGFLDLMIKSVYAFTNPKPNIIICDNGGNGRYLKKYRKHKNIKIVRHKRVYKFSNTSKKHGLGLNKAFALVKTERTAIIEPDCVVLKKGWDVIPDGYEMRACRKGVGLDGAPYYYPCFMVFYTKCLHRGGIINWVPLAGKTYYKGIPVSYNEETDKFKRYVDVGWNIYTKVNINKIDLLNNIKWSNEKAKYFRNSFSHKTNEFWDCNGNVISAHFWRGSELSRRQTYRGISPAGQKRRWFEIVQKIIDGTI